MATNTNVPNPPQPQPGPNPGQPNPTPAPVPAPTPVPTNPHEMTPEQIRQLAAGPAPAPVPIAQPAAPPAPYQPMRQADGSYAIQLPTGQIYKGASPEAAYAQLYEAQVNASRHIQQVNAEVERLRAGLAAVTGRPVEVTPGQPGQPATISWDVNLYRELEKQDPLLAQDYLDACRFGFNDINAVRPAFQSMQQTTSKMNLAWETNNFKAMAPDFPQTKEAIDLILKELNGRGLPYTAANLKLVHDSLVRSHAVDPNTGYAPLPANALPQLVAGQPQTMPTQPALPPPAPVAPPVVDANPQGLYSYGPGGFGTRREEVPTAQPAAPPAGQPAPAPPAAAYPSIPQPVAQPQPMPAAPTGAGPVAAPAGAMSEDQLYSMPTDKLRQFVEANLQR